MRKSFHHITTGVICFLFTILIAVTGYVMAGWSPLDALYMAIITIFGVGYGEVRPVQTPLLQIFTMLVIVAGCTSLAYILGGFVQVVTEGEINKALGVRRMNRTIEVLQHHIIICGFGRIGQTLARKLADSNQPFVLIDNAPERIARAQKLDYLVVKGDATDEATLQVAGINRAKGLATTLPDDALNVFITLTARGLNPNLMILARGELPSSEKKLIQAGANHVVLPAAIGALRMAHLITHPAALDFITQDDGRSTLNELLAQIDVQVDELTIPPTSTLVDQSIGDVEVGGQGTFIVVALVRADGQTVTHPDQGVRLAAGDTVIVMGHRSDIPKFARNHTLKRQMRYRGAKI